VNALRKLPAAAVLGVALSAWLMADAKLAGAADSHDAAPRTHGIWREVKWPFPTDEWGTGRAFVCHASDCGSEMSLYLRVKVGFCSCSVGITDDGELDRLGDLPLLSDKFVGLTDGHAIMVDDMTGRSRPYEVRLPLWQRQTAVAIALHAKCDAVVATVIAGRDQLAAAEKQAVLFLGEDTVMQWTQAALGS
jgi:hypothetical protein